MLIERCSGEYNRYEENMKIINKLIKQLLTIILDHIVILLRCDEGSDKYVLLSYIVHPFILPRKSSFMHRHSNMWECREIANIWLKHGYNVDVISYSNKSYIPKRSYDVLIDIHSNMERLSQFLPNAKKIMHLTGAHWSFQNDAEMKRIEKLRLRSGIEFKPVRQVEENRGIEYADCATILGNKFTKDTYEYAHKPLYSIPLSTTVEYPPHMYFKDYNKIKRNYVWIGSSGMIHKGLDLVLEVFSQMPNYKLTICGPVSNETDFEKHYWDLLYNTNNINTIGFVDVTSQSFRKIISESLGVIYPSCSEGCAGSVVTCLHAGLIPIVSYESGIDTDDFGIILHTCSVEEIRETIEDLSSREGFELEAMALKAYEYARKYYTKDNFSKEYNDFVTKIICENR